MLKLQYSIRTTLAFSLRQACGDGAGTRANAAVEPRYEWNEVLGGEEICDGLHVRLLLASRDGIDIVVVVVS
jgi:hypothetical protein